MASEDSLKFLMQQELIRYDRKDVPLTDLIGWNGTQMEQLMPEMTRRDKDGYIRIREIFFPYHLHQGIKQLGAIAETHEEKIKRLERRVKYLETKFKKS